MAGSGKRVAATVLFFIALIAVLAFYFLVFADARQLNDLPGVGEITAVAIGTAVLLAIIAIVMIVLLFKRKPQDTLSEDEPYFIPPQDEPQAAFEAVDDELVVYDVWTLPVAQRAWGGLDDPRTHSFYFPLNIDAGVYVNDYIDIDRNGSRIKLRTLLAGPGDITATQFVIPQTARAEPEPAYEAFEDPDAFEDTEALEEAPREWEPTRRARPERPSRDVPGDDFMRELERRFHDQPAGPTSTPTSSPAVTTASVATVTEGAYYDYKGDIHDVIDVEGIGPVYAEKLRQAGVASTARLCYENPATLAETIGAPEKTVRSWQAMAQLMKVSGIGPQYAEALARAGIMGIDELKRRSAARMADQVNEYLDSLDSNVLGTKITERRIAGWQAASKAMRRVRQAVPEE